MDKRTARRRAHDIVSAILAQAEATVGCWSEDKDENRQLAEAIAEIEQFHLLRGQKEYDRRGED